MKMVDPPNAPILKSGPKRSQICILAVILGVMLAMTVAIIIEAKEIGFFASLVEEPEVAE